MASKSKIVKVSANGPRIVLDSKIKKTCKTQKVNKSLILRPRFQKLGKRKRSKECRCYCSFSRKTLLKNYSNFIKSGPPQRLLYNQCGQWVDFPQEIIDLVKEDFRSKKAAIEVKVNGCHFLFHILYMIRMDLKTGAQKPIAWIDEKGNCVFPELHPTCHKNHDDVDLGVPPKINLHLEIELSKFEESMGESNVKKRIKVDQESQTETICGNVDVETARNMFVSNLGQDLKKVEICDIKKCSGSFMEAREKLFQTQVEITQKIRGKANVVYAWFVANGEVPSGIMFYAHAYNNLKLETYGYGVHLAALHSAHKSAMICNGDEKGLKHMVLCRVILGNSEILEIGSKQFRASDECFDSGVDDLQNPNCYVIWRTNLNTHIFPECSISFKTSPTQKGNPVDEEIRIQDQHASSSKPEKVLNVGSSTHKVLCFPMLLEAISDKVAPNEMIVVHKFYESYKANMMNRKELIGNLKRVVGDQILMPAIYSLQCKKSGNVKEVQEG
ncbi:hypothetical protein LXL04_017803 [Taraxacum kok-saghyz]